MRDSQKYEMCEVCGYEYFNDSYSPLCIRCQLWRDRVCAGTVVLDLAWYVMLNIDRKTTHTFLGADGGKKARFTIQAMWSLFPKAALLMGMFCLDENDLGPDEMRKVNLALKNYEGVNQ